MMYLMRLISLMMFLLIGLSSIASGRVGGALEWDYSHYASEEGGVEESDMTSFGQKYALFLDRKGSFMNGRAGWYDLSLGGEWIAVNSDIDVNGVNGDYNVSTGKLLYRGEISFAPGGLPFSFNAFARDMSESRFLFDTRLPSGSMDELLLAPNRRNILSPNIIDDIIDGSRFEMGASMVLGIKNGSYLGRYRNVLSHLPKLYVDYVEYRVKDLESRTPENYVDRELAFVSLNKKHNWFHYRFFEHIDNFNPVLSHSSKTYLLGTIDQNTRREWINLTNWIQLSVDGSYTADVNPRNTVSDENRYALNLFTTTTRRNWTSSIMSRYLRWEKADELRREAVLPVYAQGAPDRNNSWRFRFVGTAENINRPFALTSLESNEDDLYSKILWETNKSQQFVISPSLEVERKIGDKGEGWAARTTFDYFSNRSRNPATNLFSSLSVAYFSGVPGLSGLPVPYMDTELFEVVGRLDFDKSLNPRLRTGVDSLLLLGTGQAEVDVTNYVTPLSRQSFFAGSKGSNDIVIDGTVWRGSLLWFLDHVSVNRYANRYEMVVEYQDDGVDESGQYLARHRFRYRTTPYQIEILTEFLYGDDLNRSVSSRAFGTILAGAAYDGFSLSNESHISYVPNKKHQLNGKVRIDYRAPDAGESGYRVTLQQDYRYTEYQSKGVSRRLYELMEYFDYERFDPSGAQFNEAFAVTGLGNYYPTPWSRLGSKVRWEHNIGAGNDEVGVGLYTDLTFSLLSIGLEYEYGLRTISDTGSMLDRNEQRWRISIKKTF